MYTALQPSLEIDEELLPIRKLKHRQQLWREQLLVKLPGELICTIQI